MARPRKIPEGCDSPFISKRDCILAAAREVFLETGYDAASMDAVAARAGVSKATIYAHFENKKALFEQIIQSRCQGVFGALGAPEAITDVRTALTQIATAFQEMIMAPEAVALHRVIVAEAARQPEVGEAFLAAGPSLANTQVIRLFRDLSKRGLMSVTEDQAPLLADLFLSMIKGSSHTRLVLGLPDKGLDRAALVAMAVDMVVTRFAARDQGSL